MAEPKKPERPGTKDLKQDEVIARLVPDPADPPHVMRLAGYLGKSARRGFWRLYLTLELSDYVEVAEDDIIHSQALVSQDDPLAGTVVWVRSDATLQHVRTESRQAQAEFLQGDITGAFLANTRGQVAGDETILQRPSHRFFTLGCCPPPPQGTAAPQSCMPIRCLMD
jgi:hypothetical protein